MLRKTILIISVLIILAPLLHGQKLTISVMDISISEGVSGKEVMLLTETLINELVKGKAFDVTERSKRDQLLKEQEFTLTGACDEDNCLIEVGKLLMVQKMIGGAIGKLGDVYVVGLRMMDVQSGKVDHAFSKQYSGNISVLLNAMKEAADEFSKWKPGTQIVSKRLEVEYNSIKIYSKPSGAKIIINGIDAGVTPAQLDKIELGDCQISLMKDGYWQYDTLITVSKGIVKTVDVSLINASQKQTNANAGLKKIGNRGEIVNQKDGSVLMEIPSGTFTMGRNDGERDAYPSHVVYLDKFYLGKYEVTVGQFKQFCYATDRKMVEQPSWNNNDKNPVVNVSWKDAKDYCAWAGLRLPTEAEWEKGARGTDGRIYPWGNEWDKNKCRSSGDSYSGSLLVGSFPLGISPYGCYDMAGNVWEWCNDYYDKHYYQNSPERNPRGPESGSHGVIRGGCWGDGENTCRSDFRRSSKTAKSPDPGGGFRVAK